MTTTRFLIARSSCSELGFWTTPSGADRRTKRWDGFFFQYRARPAVDRFLDGWGI